MENPTIDEEDGSGDNGHHLACGAVGHCYIHWHHVQVGGYQCQEYYHLVVPETNKTKSSPPFFNPSFSGQYSFWNFSIQTCTLLVVKKNRGILYGKGRAKIWSD